MPLMMNLIVVEWSLFAGSRYEATVFSSPCAPCVLPSSQT